MANVTVKIDLRRSDKDGYYPIRFFISHRSVTTTINSKYKVRKNDWDKTKLIKRSADYISDINTANARIRKTLDKIDEFLANLTYSGLIESISVTEIKTMYLNSKNSKSKTFNGYFESQIKLKSESTAEMYRNTLRLIKLFHPPILTFNQVNISFLKKFEQWMIDSGRSQNYTRIQLRNIRAIFNSAIDDNIIEYNLYPFRKFKIKGEKTIKRSLTADSIVQIRDANLEGVPERARDIFMLIFYLIGINLKDLTHLTHKNIVDGRVIYKRMKGGKNYSIKLEPEAIELLQKYKGEKYLINLLEHYSNYDNCKREINKKLKTVAKTIKLKEALSTYYARHSWATIARNNGIRKDDIKACLGHGENTVTDIYIDLDETIKDRANRKVLDAILEDDSKQKPDKSVPTSEPSHKA